MSMESGITSSGITDFIVRLDKWLDDNVSSQYQHQPLAQDWARVSKVAEEVGEAIQALIGTTGQNPRKGVTHQFSDVVEELADVIITGYLAIQHFSKNIDATMSIVNSRWEYRMRKAVLPQ
jgi:NTP pyrophosphatase (non-canonical NTP hydrolase)